MSKTIDKVWYGSLSASANEEVKSRALEDIEDELKAIDRHQQFMLTRLQETRLVLLKHKRRLCPHRTLVSRDITAKYSGIKEDGIKQITEFTCKDCGASVKLFNMKEANWNPPDEAIASMMTARYDNTKEAN